MLINSTRPFKTICENYGHSCILYVISQCFLTKKFLQMTIQQVSFFLIFAFLVHGKKLTTWIHLKKNSQLQVLIYEKWHGLKLSNNQANSMYEFVIWINFFQIRIAKHFKIMLLLDNTNDVITFSIKHISFISLSHCLCTLSSMW